MFESGGHGPTLDLCIVERLGFGGRNVADGLEQTPVVEPVHPFKGSELHRLGMAPGTTPAAGVTVNICFPTPYVL